jgi:hypothetical protein
VRQMNPLEYKEEYLAEQMPVEAEKQVSFVIDLRPKKIRGVELGVERINDERLEEDQAESKMG